MTRLVLLLVALPALLFAGFGAVYLLWPEKGPQVKAEGQFAQMTLPWATDKKKPPTQKAPTTPAPTPTPAPAPKPQSGLAPSTKVGAETRTETAGPGWAVNCSSQAGQKDLTCSLSQTVVTRPSGQTLTNVTFLLAPENKSPEVLFQLPLGLYLPAGATYQVDANAPQRLSIRACDRQGCYARAPISPETMVSLRKGKQLKVDFKNLAEKPISIPLSLDGFASAYEKIQ
jgi:invasion protein IalB